ncbi:MAG: hypothetical protein LLF97_03470 [Planctomycetaceae bacterium]|nr:hypothetical protein [Planctomycetaceae bacterium]
MIRDPKTAIEKPDALAHFHQRQGYNCAQAVLKAFAARAGFDEACIGAFSRFGGGRAPDGECGALFAAKSLFRDRAAQQAIENIFVRAAGDATCRAIRKGKTFTCGQCVQTAADAVLAQLENGCVLQRPAECGR